MPGRRFRFRGRVQGVGFRPSAWRLAQQQGLRGQVYNDRAGATVELWGPEAALDAFPAELNAALPEAAHVESITTEPLPGAGPAAFRIVPSALEGSGLQVLPDLASCPDCLREVQDASNRRFRYALTNCTQCGPRYSILHDVPYDRSRTSMATFPLCPACAQEFADPADRRFHAQPIACPQCGPSLTLEVWNAPTHALPDDPLDATAALLRQGAIVALKGIGGFHLACDAQQPDVVERLRTRKHRPHKPFALMAKDEATLRRFAQVSAEEAAWLKHPAAPIVLLDPLPASPLPEGLAPGQSTLGGMLPYTPLHHLLLQTAPEVLVMTSANRSGAPQCMDEAEVREQLNHVADALLGHNRPIVHRCDDSVLRVLPSGPQVLRRARGLAPDARPLPPGFANTPPLLACGADLKSTFCLVQEGQAMLAPHIGDLHEFRTLQAYQTLIAHFLQLHSLRPTQVVTDLHPDYASTRFGEAWATEQGLPTLGVQHHHAHLAACLGEHGLPRDTPPVWALLLDGLGFGTDGTFWGGELGWGTYQHLERVGRLQPLPLIGGNQAMREPWRNTLAHLDACFGWEALQQQFPDLLLVRHLQTKPVTTLTALARNSPRSSSCGRWFDAVAAALGLGPDRLTFEGQAAQLLEAQVDLTLPTRYPFHWRSDPTSGLLELDPRPFWEALLQDLRHGTPLPAMATAFHRGLAEAWVSGLRKAQALHPSIRTNTVALAGGVFQNRTLLTLLENALQQSGFEVLRPQQIPPNDGGIAFGQALIAAARSTASTSSSQRN